MKNEYKHLKIKTDDKIFVKEVGREKEKSQAEMKRGYRIELSLQEYGRLTRRALAEGCSPEELVARRISMLLSGEK